MCPEEFLIISVSGEPDITKNFISIKQDLCRVLQLHQILEQDYNLKRALVMLEGKKSLEMEVTMLQNALSIKKYPNLLQGLTEKSVASCTH